MRSDESWPAEEEHIRVRGEGLTAVVVPARGGKVISLLDDRGVEWLTQPVARVGPPARPGADFLAGEMAGWDECAPSIVACTVDGVAIADHGELWMKQAEVAGAEVTMEDSTLGYRFRRLIESAPGGLVLHYAVTARENPVPFLWAAHPQFRAPIGSRVRLPASVGTVIDVMDPALPRLPWTDHLATVDSVVEGGGFRKVYADPGHPVHAAALIHPDGAALNMSWSEACPFVGIWFDRFDFRHDPVIAIEPSTAYFDSLSTAIENGLHPWIGPGDTLTWTVELSVSAGDEG